MIWEGVEVRFDLENKHSITFHLTLMLITSLGYYRCSWLISCDIYEC